MTEVILRDTSSPTVVLREPKFAIVPLASADSAAAHRAVIEAIQEADRAEIAADGAETAEQGVIAALDGVILSNATIGVASIAILSAIDPTLGIPVYLTQAGREGVFVFDDSDLSAMVTLDTENGLYVAPHATTGLATDGTDGAWVRRFDGRAIITWWGVVPGIGSVGAKAQAALATLDAHVQNVAGYGYGGYSLRVPATHYGSYNMGTYTLDIPYPMIFEGDNPGGPSGGASVLKWDDNTTGLRTQSGDTSGATAGPVSVYTHAGGMVTIRNLVLVGGYVGTESESHAVHLRIKAKVQDVSAYDWGGDFIHAHASSTDNTGYRGNDNGTIIDNCFAQYIRNYASLFAPDSNTFLFIQPHAVGAREWGIKSVGNYGFNLIGGDFTLCGYNTGPYSMVSYQRAVIDGGDNVRRYYSVIPEQESWASTNPPTGLYTKNQGWIPLEGDGAINATHPNWSNGVSLRAGGPIYQNAPGASWGRVIGAYSERDAGPSYFSGSTIVDSPILGLCLGLDGSLWGGQERGGVSGMFFDRGLKIGRTDLDGSTWASWVQGQVEVLPNDSEFLKFRTKDGTTTWSLTGDANGFNIIHGTADYIGKFTTLSTGVAGETFGRTVDFGPAVFFPRIAIGGSDSLPRFLDYRGAPPTSGDRAGGEICFRSGTPSVSGSGSHVGWSCVGGHATSGGTWREFGGQAAAQANSTAVNIADIVIDFNALLTKLRDSKQMET